MRTLTRGFVAQSVLILLSTGVSAQNNRIINLYDAIGHESNGTVFDFGFSALVEYDGKTILFDSGTNADILKRNVEALGVDLEQVDFAVGSHAHADHVSGFDYLLEVNPKVKIYLPEDFFGLASPFQFGIQGTDPEAASALPTEFRYFGDGTKAVRLNSSGRFWKANVEYIKESVRLGDGITLVFTRSPFIGYFYRYPNMTGAETDDGTSFVGLPELSLALETSEGLVLVVGCSHSTVEKIAVESKSYLSREVYLVMGGYHLLPYSAEEISGLVTRLQDDVGVKLVAPAHCTGPLGFKIFRERYGSDFLSAGLGSEIRF